jgi:transposase
MGRRELSVQFKQEAVQRVLEHGDTVKVTAKKLGISETALRRWLGSSLPTSLEGIQQAQEKARIQALEVRVAELESERETLQRSIAALAGDTNRK